MHVKVDEQENILSVNYELKLKCIENKLKVNRVHFEAVKLKGD